MTRLVARSVAPILTAVAVFLPAPPMSAGGPLAVPRNHPIGTKVNAFRAVTGIPAGVAEKSVPPALALAAAAPNPVAGFAKIRFVLPAEGWARLALYDVAGRRVRTLFEGAMPSGPRVADWDGRDDRGGALPAAVYFARLESGGAVIRAKVVLLGQ